MIASRLHFRLRRQWAGPGRAPLSWCRGQDRPSYYKLNYRQSRLTWAGPGCGAVEVVPGQERPQTLNNLNNALFGPDQAVAPSRGAGSGTSILPRQSISSLSGHQSESNENFGQLPASARLIGGKRRHDGDPVQLLASTTSVETQRDQS